jgi:hypothetical protein
MSSLQTWTPRHQPSPSCERKDFRPINFDSNSLKRAKRSVSILTFVLPNCYSKKIKEIERKSRPFSSHIKGWLQPTKYLHMYCRVQYRAVWCLPKYWHPTPSPPSECVIPPHQRQGGGGTPHTRWAVRRWVVNILEDARHIGLASYRIISLRCSRFFHKIGRVCSDYSVWHCASVSLFKKLFIWIFFAFCGRTFPGQLTQI